MGTYLQCDQMSPNISKNGPKVTAWETARDTIAESFGMVILLFVRPAIKANFNMSNKLSKSSWISLVNSQLFLKDLNYT